MVKEIVFKSNGRVTVTVENDIIRINRKGIRSFFTQGLKGEKSIPIRNITAIQIKKPGLATGYIQFSQHGMLESTGGVFDAVLDENTIVFHSKKEYRKAEELKEYIETVQSEQNNQTAVTTSGADEILKYKELLDAGVISEEEFEAKKKQILGL